MFFKKRSSLSTKSFVSLGLSFSIFLVLILGCLGGSSKKCTGELTVDGKKYNGIDKTEATAKRNSCAKYCIEGDSEMDSRYRVWLDSLSEKEKERVRKGDKGKWDAIYKDKSLRRYVERCEKSCLAKNEDEISVTCTE